MIDGITGASKEESSPPPGEDAPSQAATLEPDKTDRGERPRSSEYCPPPPMAGSQPLLLLPFEAVFLVFATFHSAHIYLFSFYT